jgi:hypothetical protein
MNNRLFAILVFTILSTHHLHAQTDAPGCADHPLLDRVQGYYIERCSEDARPLMVATAKKKQVEVAGSTTTIAYYGYADHLPNGYYLIKTYERAIKARGGEKLFWDNGNSGNKPRATFRLVEDGKEFWITLTNFRGVSTEGVTSYDLTIIEKG